MGEADLYLWRAILATLGLAVLALVAWYAIQHGSPGWREARGKRLLVIEALPVSMNGRLLLVEADGRRLLVGATPGSVRLVADLGPAAEPEDTADREDDGGGDGGP